MSEIFFPRKKYAETSARDRALADSQTSEDITRQSLLPNVKDPNLWTVKCRQGEERETCLQLMRKFLAYERSEDPLQIKSVLTVEGVKGYVYIEAFKQTHVRQAIENISNLRMGLNKEQMVPIKEMTDVLKVVRSTGNVKPKQWVRVKRGQLYKDDLAQVLVTLMCDVVIRYVVWYSNLSCFTCLSVVNLSRTW